MGLVELGEDAGVACRGLTGGAEVVESVVAAVAGGGAGDVALEGGYPSEHIGQDGNHLGRLDVTLKDEVVACAAAHGAPVDDAAAPFGVVAQPGGGEVLDGV